MHSMRRRTRFLIGLVLLGTMGVSFAETVWAAACSPNMGDVRESTFVSMDGMREKPGREDMDDMSESGMPANHDCLPSHAQDPSHTGDDVPPCPFSPAGGAQGCVATASLPASVGMLSSPAPLNLIIPPSAVAAPHLLHAATIFHPPKA